MEIRDEHVEYAVVERLHNLLDEASHADFPITQTYSYFAAVVCWVVQRLRLDDENLEKWSEQIFEMPWLVLDRPDHSDAANVRRLHSKAAIRYTVGNSFCTIGDLFIGLRNSIAHGDHRTVVPFHRKGKNSSTRNLLGFTFVLRRGRTEFAELTLEREDMRRIGMEVVQRFMKGLKVSSHFVDDSKIGVVERRVS